MTGPEIVAFDNKNKRGKFARPVGSSVATVVESSIATPMCSDVLFFPQVCIRLSNCAARPCVSATRPSEPDSTQLFVEAF